MRWLYSALLLWTLTVSVSGDTISLGDKFVFDVALQYALNEYENKTDPYLDFLLNDKRHVLSLLTRIEREYPNSRYSINQHKSVPFGNSCSAISPLEYFNNMSPLLLKRPALKNEDLEEKAVCTPYSSTLSTLSAILHDLPVNWRLRTRYYGNRTVVKVIIILANQFDASEDITINTLCDPPSMRSLWEELMYVRPYIALFATEETYCLWNNRLADINYTDTVLYKFKLSTLEDDIMELLKKIVHYEDEFGEKITEVQYSAAILNQTISDSSAASTNCLLGFILNLTLLLISIII